MISKIKKNYHWLIAVIVFIEMLIFGGLINSGSVYIQPVSMGLGVSTTAYAVAGMPYTVFCFLGTFMSGAVFKRFGYKKTATFSLFLLSVSLIISATAKGIIIFAISKALFGMSYGACFTAGAAYIVKSWFYKYQGTVLGAVSMSSGVGGSLMTILLTKIINTYGWRMSYTVTAIIVAALALLYLLIKDRPEQLGLQLYGYEEGQKDQKSRRGISNFAGYPLKDQLKRPMFYLMCVCVFTSCICLFTTSGYLVPHYISQGFTSNQAAMYQSVYMLVLSAVKILLGILYDRVGSKPITIGCMLCAIFAQAIMAYTANSVLNWVAVLLFSAGLCMSSIMVPLMASDIFGHRAIVSINGILVGLCAGAPLVSSPLSSMCYDATGSYTPVYKITCVVLVVILILYMWIFSIAKKDRELCTAKEEVSAIS